MRKFKLILDAQRAWAEYEVEIDDDFQLPEEYASVEEYVKYLRPYHGDEGVKIKETSWDCNGFDTIKVEEVVA